MKLKTTVTLRTSRGLRTLASEVEPVSLASYRAQKAQHVANAKASKKKPRRKSAA